MGASWSRPLLAMLVGLGLAVLVGLGLVADQAYALVLDVHRRHDW